MKKNIFRRRRVVMATIGSLGDLHPYIALALEMRKRYVEPGADLLVTHPIVLAGPLVAQKTGIPWVSTELPASLWSGFDPWVPPNTPWLHRVLKAGGPDVDLLRFLGRGPAPIVFTLGSAAVHIAGNFYRESIKAAKLLNRRAVLLVGSERNRPTEPLPEGIIAVNYAPFGELLPRAAAMVHQGGVGTTGQGLRAGIPMLVVPFAHDQHDNGARVERLGVARTIARTSYKAERVASELKELLGNPSYAQTAREVSNRVRAERGGALAVDLILDQLNTGRLRSVA